MALFGIGRFPFVIFLGIARFTAIVAFMATKQLSLGRRIAQSRNGRGLTIRQLATASGLNPLSIRKIENGQRANPRIDTMKKLAKALGMSLDDLAG